jgi:DNA polymerase-3 subunit alpha
MAEFVHLHVHSHYSILDGMSKVPDLVDKCMRTGMRAMALTDHGNMFGIKDLKDYVKKVNGAPKKKVKECEENIEKETDPAKKAELEAELVKLKEKAEAFVPFKPIIGTEAYCARRTLHDKDKTVKEISAETGKERIVDRSGHHLILLAKNKAGYKSLCKLASIAYTEGYYDNPRIDKNVLKQYHEGLIVCSACLGGEIPQLIIAGKIDEAEKSIMWFKEIFGDDYYLELQRHKTDKPNAATDTYERQQEVNKVLIELARKTNTKIIATNDVHFVEEEHGEAHDRLICLSTGKDYDDPNRLHYTKQEWLKTPDEMYSIFEDIPEALTNTLEIADKVEVYDIDSDPIMPKFDIPADFGTEEEYRKKFTEKDLFDEFTQNERHEVVLSQEDAEKKIKKLGGYEKLYRIKLEADYLNKLAWDGAKKRYGDHLTEEQIERITFELHIMKTMGFPGYFLIVQDYIRAAREELGVSVGPGRGSAAGSVVAYCLWITDLDPLKYDLLFERFLNPDRISLPDIDVDFDDDGRSKVLTWVRKRYGEEKVAHIITYGTMATKSSVADVGRVQKVPLPTVNAIKALIPDRGFDEEAVKAVEGTLPKKMPKVNLKNCFKYIPQLRDMKNGPDENISTMLTYAQELEDTNRQVGIHACGVIIGADDLTNFAPVCTIHDKKLDKDVVVTQYDGHVVESVGLIKMDFLGLSTLTLIKEALANVKKARGIEVDISNIPIDDELTYQLYSEGRTIGTFQFESPGMQKYLRELKPTQITDLIAMNALYRPGPIEYIPTFIRRKNGLEPIEYDIPVMEKYLKDTYGVTVYQEQVMLLSRLLANFTRGEADTLRKAMGKKIFAMLAILKPKFIEGGKKNGHDPEILEKIWKDWEKFASYAFNKSHAACYAWVAYQTGYLKAHYPAEYMAANLTLSKDNIADVQKFMEECKAMKIKVKGPDVNESELNFTVNQTGEIRFGLGGVKGIGEGAVMAIVSEREKNGPYTSIFDFVERVDLKACNRKTIESLALSGAFDSLPDCSREQIMATNDKGRNFSEVLCQYGTQCKLSAQSAAQSLFGGDVGMKPQQPVLPKVEMWSDLYKLEKEKELVGIYLSAHPLDAYYVFLNYICNVRMSDLNDDTGFGANHLDQDLMMGGVITEAVSTVSKRGTPCRFITVEDYSGSYRFALFRSEDIVRFSPYEKGMMVYISGRFAKRRYGDFIDFNISEVKPLADESRDFSGNLSIKIKEENVSPDFVTNFLSLIDGQSGNVNLSFSVVEPTTGTAVNVTSRTRKIKLTRPLMEYLEQMQKDGTVDLSVA